MSTTSPPRPPLAPHDCLRFEVAEYLRRTQGRETFLAGPTPDSPAGCVVKRTLEASSSPLFAWVRARADPRSAGRREYENLVALAACGVPVPRALSCGEETAAEGRRSVVVMERVVHRENLRQLLARAAPPERRAAERALGDIVSRLHALGFVHRDLYLQHVLVRSSDGALVLIDAGRVRRSKALRARWFVKDLAALLHSAPGSVSVREKLRFLARWLDDRGITQRGARRRWLRAVIAKRARMAAHVPRDERVREAAR